MIVAPAPVVAEPVIVRPARPDEHTFIRLQWVRSYEHSSFGRTMRRDVFRTAWGRVVNLLMARSRVLCLCPEDSPEATVYGWMCWEPEYRGEDDAQPVPVLHYVHVRAQSRRLGYGARLLGELPAAYFASHSTQEWARLLERWEQDRSIALGKCHGLDCGHPYTVSQRGDIVHYSCERKPRPGRPACGVRFERPAKFTAPPHPVVTVDLTRV